MTYDIQKVQAQLQCDILVCKTVSNNKHQYSFLGIIQSHNSETVRELKIGHVAKAQKRDKTQLCSPDVFIYQWKPTILYTFSNVLLLCILLPQGTCSSHPPFNSSPWIATETEGLLFLW